MTRRSLLLAGAGVAAAAAIPNVAVAGGKKLGRPSEIDRSTWQPLVGTILETRNRGYARVPLLLTRIEDAALLSGQTARHRERSFILFFRGPAGQPLAEGTHKLFVPRVGKIDIWLSSAKLTDDDGWEYMAVFANARLRQRPPKKPRLKGSKKQRRQRARKRRRQFLRGTPTP